jgi:hypothetical protein
MQLFVGLRLPRLMKSEIKYAMVIAIYPSTVFFPTECLHVSFLMLFSMFLFVL